MIPYVGCERARDLLDGFLDDELAMDEQVAIESHLRWCRTCALRVEDMRLIGASLRMGSPLHRGQNDETGALAASAAETLARFRAERQESLPVKVRELFSDMRLLWPALGATSAVALCVALAGAVLQASTLERPGSVAAILGRLSEFGSERNPLRPDGGNTIPRAADDGASLERIAREDSVFLLNTIVGRDGRVATADLVQTNPTGSHSNTETHAQHVQDVLQAAMQTRFAPAQTPIGQAVAVNVPWMIVAVVTTADKEEAPPPKMPAVETVTAAPAADTQPPAEDAAPPVNRRSGADRQLPTA
jgi:hypothetical protein